MALEEVSNNRVSHEEFMRLFLQSERDLLRYVMAFVPRVSDARDIVQNTAVALWKKIDRYDPNEAFTPWAFRFAALEAKEFLRKEARWHRFLDDEVMEMLATRRNEMSKELDERRIHLRECLRKLREGQSLMDAFAGRIKRLQRDVGGADRERLDQFFSSVREVEKRLVINEEWEKKPKPIVPSKAPRDNLDPGALVQRTRNMYDLARLALETDSTRLVTILVTQGFNPKVDLPGVTLPHHALTHQANQPASHQQLATIERAQMTELARLLGSLRSAKEDADDNLLDRTMVLQGSNLGHAGKHDNRNLPVLLAGGGFQHGQHLRFDRNNNRPLANLYTSMLQRLGLETEKFSTATGRLSGLEAV